MKLKTRSGAEVAFPNDSAAAARYLADTIQCHGVTPDGEEVAWSSMADAMIREAKAPVKDAISTSNIQPLLSRSTEILWREPVEPLLTITNLFTRVQARGLQTTVLAGALGAVGAAQEISEGGAYPEVMFQVGGAVQTAWIGKSGIQAAYTDEALRYSTWDIMAYNLRRMGASMARFKEQKAVAFLRSLGVTLFDNLAPTNSAFGVLTGRGIDMAANGTMIMDDLFKGFAHMTEQGFTPDTILVSPLFFYQFIQDPVLRDLFMIGAGGAYFQKWNGVAGPRDPWSNGSMGNMGPSHGNSIVPGGAASGETATGIAGREHGMTASFNVPSYFPWQLNVMVSPFVPYDKNTQLGDVYLLSSGEVGFHLIDEDQTETTWRDENNEITKVKLKERSGFAIANEGQAIGVMKNVKMGRSFWDGTISAETMAVDSGIDATTDLGL